MAETYEVFFVRHGISCANIWSERQSGLGKIKANMYPDPELTEAGILRSRILSNNLKKLIQQKWPDNKYVVCSSPLIRAWETAYYMLPPDAPDPSNPGAPNPYIHIIPAVAELGITPDNKALDFEEQNTIVEKIDNNIIPYIKSDYREYLKRNYSNDLNGLKNFINDFLGSFRINQDKTLFKNVTEKEKKKVLHNDIISTQLKIGDIIIYRFVIFSHSNYIFENFKKELKPKLNGKSKISNNDVIFVKWSGRIKEYSNLEYFDHGLEKTDYGCPDNCRDKDSYCTKKYDKNPDKYHEEAIDDILKAMSKGKLTLDPYEHPIWDGEKEPEEGMKVSILLDISKLKHEYHTAIYKGKATDNRQGDIVYDLDDSKYKYIAHGNIYSGYMELDPQLNKEVYARCIDGKYYKAKITGIENNTIKVKFNNNLVQNVQAGVDNRKDILRGDLSEELVRNLTQSQSVILGGKTRKKSKKRSSRHSLRHSRPFKKYLALEVK